MCANTHTNLEQPTAATDGTETTLWCFCFAEAKAALLVCDYSLGFFKLPTGSWDFLKILIKFPDRKMLVTRMKYLNYIFSCRL